jgi:hypothetical protein
MSNVNSAPGGREALAFGTWRRLVVTQIICRGDLSPAARVVAYAIAQASNRNTRSTYASSMTIGQKVDLFPDEVSAAITEVVKNGQARTKQRDNGTRDIFLLLRGDVEMPDLAVRAGSEFYKTGKYRQFIVERAKFLDRIFADRRLTATDKIIAFAALRLIAWAKACVRVLLARRQQTGAGSFATPTPRYPQVRGLPHKIFCANGLLSKLRPKSGSVI